MMRVSLFVVMMAAVLALSTAEEAVQHQTEDVKQSSPLTAIQLPSESLYRAAKTAARALADNMPSSLNLSANMVHALAVAGAVVVGLVGAVAVLALVLPMFGFRMCYLFGNCETYAHAYLAPTAYDAYAYSQPAYATAAYAKSYDGVTNELPYYEAYQHPQQAVTYPTGNSVAANVYQKRSLEYVGPILKMLSNAYEKYNHHPAQSKAVESKTGSSSSAEPKTE